MTFVSPSDGHFGCVIAVIILCAHTALNGFSSVDLKVLYKRNGDVFFIFPGKITYLSFWSLLAIELIIEFSLVNSGLVPCASHNLSISGFFSLRLGAVKGLGCSAL